MIRRTFLSFFALALTLPAADLRDATPQEAGLSSDRLERISRIIQADVDAGRISGAVGLVARDGRVAYFETFGDADREEGRPMQEDTIFRIYSMSKPITSVGLMMLHERGAFQLQDKVSDYLPELEGLEVNQDNGLFPGDPDHAHAVEARREMTIQDLLRHTSGLSYGFFGDSTVDKLYREAEVLSNDGTLADMVDKLADLPLLYHPGEKWHYSVAVDVQGRLIEVLSGQRLDRYLQEKIFEPLGMVDTGFHVPAEKHDRFAQMYSPTEESKEAIEPADPERSERFMSPGTFFMAGGGLVSTTRDYLRFCEMLLNGGKLKGARILGRKTVELMTRDHLVGVDDERAEETGYGFGLGFAVHKNPAASGSAASVGEYNWGGAAGTKFWIDPEERMIGIYMVQILPHDGLEYGNMFKQLAYQAVAD